MPVELFELFDQLQASCSNAMQQLCTLSTILHEMRVTLHSAVQS